jgi:hypothetical protein
MQRSIYLIAVTLAMAACSGGDSNDKPSTSWLSTGGPCEELEGIENNPEAKEGVGLMFCGNAGRTFTGELRCERDFIEVECR